MVVNGLGGRSAREYNCPVHSNDTWWASVVASNYSKKNEMTAYGPNCLNSEALQLKPGVLFLSKDAEDTDILHGEFIDTDGTILDKFTVTSQG